VALAQPGRIASMALYEPSAFHLLRQMSEGAPRPTQRSPAARGVSVADGSRVIIRLQGEFFHFSAEGRYRRVRCRSSGPHVWAERICDDPPYRGAVL
jgi:hypothetical protein